MPPSLPQLLQQASATYPDHEAVVFAGRSMDYKTLDALSTRVAGRLVAEGIGKGDRVGLYCINSDIFPVAYFGILKAGATVVPINLLLSPPEVAYILNDSGARGLLYFELFGELVAGIAGQLESVTLFGFIGQQAAPEGHRHWKEFVEHEEPAPDVEIDPADDVASIIYTSGTTGQPKGAMLTHGNLAANTESARAALEMVPGEDRVLTVLPMFHAFAATACMLTPLFSGCTVVALPKFEPELVADTIAATGATLFMGVPSMYASLLRLPDSSVEKLSGLKHCISGGAAMPVEVMRQFEERFGTLIYEGDGPTECSPVTCCNPIGGERKPGSVGVCVPDVQMRILDDDGQERPGGEIGEICVKGPNVMKGYWNRAEETAESFFGEWFRTGDLGYVDEDGYFFIVDRKKDMIIVNGMNVYPRVVEEVLYQCEGVREAAVIGVPSRLHGELPWAYVSLDEGAGLDDAALRGFCRERLGRHQVPRKFIFLDDLPKNATGKIMKRELRVQGEQERGIDHSES